MNNQGVLSEVTLHTKSPKTQTTYEGLNCFEYKYFDKFIKLSVVILLLAGAHRLRETSQTFKV